MTDPRNNPRSFGSAAPVAPGGVPCDEVEAMLMDALDGILTDEEQARFDRHLSTCAACARMVADTQRGAALLEMLRTPRPEPSAALFERIIAQTSGAQAAIQPSAEQTMLHVVPTPGLPPAPLRPANVLSFPQRFARHFTMSAMQPRLAMTAAMAFFSIALTFNLVGVHPTQLRASDLSPSSLKRTAYSTGASAIRYFDSLRVVYELESRVNELKRDSDSEPAQPASGTHSNSDDQKDDSPSRPAPAPGSSRSADGNSVRMLPVSDEIHRPPSEKQGPERNRFIASNVLSYSNLISQTEREIAPRKGGLA